jgi:hypothetical protein
MEYVAGNTDFNMSVNYACIIHTNSTDAYVCRFITIVININMI